MCQGEYYYTNITAKHIVPTGVQFLPPTLPAFRCPPLHEDWCSPCRMVTILESAHFQAL